LSCSSICAGVIARMIGAISGISSHATRSCSPIAALFAS
jgi:hypothetical protein